MSHSDDPPFLNVGTEVSAKYRGAFCEATIKVAKKLVKCKVSYSKGQTAVVINDVIKGCLKLGMPVEVRQPDGQFQTATITKLTDQSTYTVVFDDGDERTLKRSSLCLKGARHFHESETLDHQPLTDPENFGTPVMQSSKKYGRKRTRQLSHSSSAEEEPTRKKFCYPPEFPVGKAVFLENDRRRSCWLPAVVVPAHFVMEESFMTPDTICIRSFKDGRFFASAIHELHDFAPDKEPLSSMLEGEIQAMYMHKPAIERAMAYLDTGELPWGMDLFDTCQDESHSPPPTVEEKAEEEMTAEMDAFMDKLRKFHENKGTPMVRQPMLGQKDLNLWKLYELVKENGGMERVTQELKWRSLYLQLGMPPMPNASYQIKQAYKKYLHAFEVQEKAGVKVKESPGRASRRRAAAAAAAAILESDEEQERTKTPKAEKQEKPVKPDRTPKQNRLDKTEKIPKQDKTDKPERIPKQDKAERTPKQDKPDKPERTPKQDKPEKPERTPKQDKPDKAERTPKQDKPDKPERTPKQDKPDKPERTPKQDKPDKPERTPKQDKPDKPERTPKQDKQDKPERTPKQDKPDKPERTPKQDKPDKPERTPKQDKPEKPERTPKQDKPEKPERTPKQDKSEKASKANKTEKMSKQDKPERISNTEKQEKPERTPKVEKPERTPKPERPVRLGKQVSKDSSKETEEEKPDSIPDVKSEMSDQEVDSTSTHSTSDDTEELSTMKVDGVTPSSEGYLEGDRVLVWHGRGKTLRTYEAKILGVEESEDLREYLVHYNGWNIRYDEWIEEGRIAGKALSPTKGTNRPFYSSKQKKDLKNKGKKEANDGSKWKKDKEKKPPQSVGKQQETSTPTSNGPVVVNGNNKGQQRGPGRPPKKRRPSAPIDEPGNESPFSPESIPTIPEFSPPSEASSTSSSSSSGGSSSQKMTVKDESSELLEVVLDILLKSDSQESGVVLPDSKGEKERMDTDGPIVVKREENHSWSSSSAGDTLLCSERLPVLAGDLRPKSNIKEEELPMEADTSSMSPVESSPLSLKHPLSPVKSPPPASPSKSEPSSSADDTKDKDGDNCEEKIEVDTNGKSSEEEEEDDDMKSSGSSEKSSLNHSQDRRQCSKSSPTEGKRRPREWESDEAYEERKRARRADMNYVIDFAEHPEMSSLDRISLIQEQLREVHRKWSELKAEVAYLDRKRRRARRKEREAARNHANHAHQQQQQQPSPAIECH